MGDIRHLSRQRWFYEKGGGLMRIYKMFLLRWKACIRKPYVWAFILMAVLTATIPAVSSQFDSKTKLPIGLVNEDGGELSKKLDQFMGDYGSNVAVYRYNRDKALRLLAMGRLEAVYIINQGFSEKLERGEYEGVITLYTTPASSAAQSLSETILNSTLSVWMEEKALIELNNFLKDQGVPFTDSENREARERFDGLLLGYNTVKVISHIPAPPETGDANAVFLSSNAWYAAFSSLFVILSAGWVIDTRRRVLGERIQAAGIHPLSVYAGSALAIIALSMAGWVFADIIISVILKVRPDFALRLILPALLYMSGIMGITITVSSLLSKTVQLMLIAPVFTITQGVLCGMLLKLPDWAGTLSFIAGALPGRWFNLSADTVINGASPIFLLGAAVCALAWLSIGTLALYARTRKIAASPDK